MKTPIDAEARGKIRVFRAAVIASSAAIEKVLDSRKFHQDVGLLYLKGRKGQQRIEARIKRALSGIVWHSTIDSTGVLLGAYLEASDAIISAGDDPGFKQPSIVVSYLLVTEQRIYQGIWTLEVPEHALRRLVQRDPRANLRNVLFAAHNEALRVGVNGISLEQEFLLATPPNGVFLSEFIVAPDAAYYNEINVFIRPRTWLHNDQLNDDQVPVKRGSPALCTSFLLPAPLKEIKYRDGELIVRPRRLRENHPTFDFSVDSVTPPW